MFSYFIVKFFHDENILIEKVYNSCLLREIPRELLHLNRGGEVHVNMNDKRHEDYVKRKETMKAFTGKGHYLGRLELLPTL